MIILNNQILPVYLYAANEVSELKIFHQLIADVSNSSIVSDVKNSFSNFPINMNFWESLSVFFVEWRFYRINFTVFVRTTSKRKLNVFVDENKEFEFLPSIEMRS